MSNRWLTAIVIAPEVAGDYITRLLSVWKKISELTSVETNAFAALIDGLKHYFHEEGGNISDYV